jgi:tRNA(Ile)-lysidine synthase
MVNKIKKHILKHKLLTTGAPILLACSGGRDSMFALDILRNLGYTLGVAHCNFKLRIKESDEEEEFVKSYCENLEIPFFAIQFDTEAYAKTHKVSTQMAARELRYEWLEKIRKENNYQQIVTAHHLNDQAETIFINITNGTGIEGLRGIPPKNGHIVRPFLSISRKEIDAYISQKNIPFCDDSSNNSDKYERNFLRHHIIKPLEDKKPNFLHSIEQMSAILEEQTLIYKEKINDYKKKLLKNHPHYDTIQWDLLSKHPAGNTLFYEIMRDYNFSSNQCKDIFENLKDALSGSQFYSESHTLSKDRNLLYIQPKEAEIKKIAVFEHLPKQIVFNNFKIKLSTLPVSELNIKTSDKYAYFDLDKIQFPLTIRYWKDGDYFYPYGLTKPKSDKPGKKKVAKYFKDEKISVVDKNLIPLLFSGGYLIWLVGNRIDHRFAVTEKTKNVLKCQIIDSQRS